MINIPTTLSGRLHPCYPYKQQFDFCSSKSYYPQADCAKWREDYVECVTKGRLTAMMAEAEKERRKHKLISVPHYIRETDEFVFDDGRVVQNSDKMFRDIPWR